MLNVLLCTGRAAKMIIQHVLSSLSIRDYKFSLACHETNDNLLTGMQGGFSLYGSHKLASIWDWPS